ncbi:terminase small subunit, partial [Enterococcus faecalis]|uniref:terminase small subunit n=1 Tax=Enterococcus faecalis TaxID=1351 RepID=UPI0029364A1F
MVELKNNKQEQFAKEYLIDLNATQAAIRAGYYSKTAYSQGQRLLKNVEIQTRISELMNERSRRTEITADRVIQEIAKIAFSDIGEYMTWDQDGNITMLS